MGEEDRQRDSATPKASLGADAERLFSPELVEAMVRQSRLSQGFSARVTDPAVLSRLAVLVVKSP